MKKIISMVSAVLVMFALSSPLTSIAKSAEFFTIGTGGPTGVYFQTGNAICKMLHKQAISADHGRKKGTAKAYSMGHAPQGMPFLTPLTLSRRFLDRRTT